MAGQEKKRNPRSTALILDLLHIVIGILVVICAILAFLDPEGNSILFPVIFWLAALLNGIVGGFRLKMSGHDKKKQAGVAVQCLLAVILTILGVLSAISIWR